MDDLISKEKAYEVLTEYYHHKTEIQHKALREALDMVPHVDIDLSDYSDRLWRNAYEQGKAVSKDALDEAYAHGYTAAESDSHKQNQWIPCERELPELDTYVLVSHVGSVFVDHLEMEEGDLFFWETGVSLPEEIRNLAWMPLPEPYKGGAE